MIHMLMLFLVGIRYHFLSEGLLCPLAGHQRDLLHPTRHAREVTRGKESWSLLPHVCRCLQGGRS